MTNLEDLLRESLREHADEAPEPSRLIAAVSTARRPAPGRRRPAAAAGVMVAAAAVVATTFVGVAQVRDSGDLGTADTPAATATDDTAPSATPSVSPPSPAPTNLHGGPLVVPTAEELSTRLATVLPGPSTPKASATFAQGDIAASAARVFDNGTVNVTVDNLMFKESDVVRMCEETGNDGPDYRGMDCVTTDTGWLTTSRSDVDAGNADAKSRQNRVWFYGLDGRKVSVWATNYTTDDASNPTTTEPVLDLDQLTALATTIDWYA